MLGTESVAMGGSSIPAVLTPTKLHNRITLHRREGRGFLHSLWLYPLPPLPEGTLSPRDVKSLLHDHRVSDQDSAGPKSNCKGKGKVGERWERKRGGAFIHSFTHSFLHSLLHSTSKYCLLGAGATNMNLSRYLPLRASRQGGDPDSCWNKARRLQWDRKEESFVAGLLEWVDDEYHEKLPKGAT